MTSVTNSPKDISKDPSEKNLWSFPIIALAFGFLNPFAIGVYTGLCRNEAPGAWIALAILVLSIIVATTGSVIIFTKNTRNER